MQHLEVSGAVRHIYIYVIRRLKVNTIARPGLNVYAAPRRIPPSPHRRGDFSLFIIFSPCLQIALALGTEWSGN